VRVLAGLLLGSMFLVQASAQDYLQGLQAHWKLDETSGLVASDSVGGNDGDLNNFSGDDSYWVDGTVNGALEFDGSNYIIVPDAPAVGADLVNGFSVATWFNSNVALSTGGNTYRMLEKGNSYFFLQSVSPGGMNFLVKRNGANFIAAIGIALEHSMEPICVSTSTAYSWPQPPSVDPSTTQDFPSTSAPMMPGNTSMA
jgi:hypothetical protein